MPVPLQVSARLLAEEFGSLEGLLGLQQEDRLTAIPGVGPKTAAAVLEW